MKVYGTPSLIIVVSLASCLRVETAFVDPGVIFSTWAGWGSSLAWFGDVLGGFEQEVQDEINSALFSVCFINLHRLICELFAS